MKLEIDFALLVHQDLTPSQYCYLWMIYHNDYTYVEYTSDADIPHLLENNYIFLEELTCLYVLRPAGIALFEVANPQQKWQEFKANYPIKSGTRRLHDQQEKCKEKYLRLIKKPGTHEEIIKGLNNELEARRAAGMKNTFFPDWKTMSVWLNQKHWLTYLDKIQEDEQKQRIERI